MTNNFLIPDFDNILHEGLYIIATPLGNKHDITLRALHILSKCDVILCEDTRHTRKLLMQYNITSPSLIAYHDHNEAYVAEKIVQDTKKYSVIGLVSDAGTPLINDPGFDIVRLWRAQNKNIFTVPGPSAAIAALSIAGIACNEFCFLGFPPHKKNAFERFCTKIHHDMSFVIYLSIHKHQQQLEILASQFPTRPALLLRELTKLHEEHIGHTLQDINKYAHNHDLKGELVLIIGKDDNIKKSNIEDYHNHIIALKKNNMIDKDIANTIAQKSDLSKREIYNYIQKYINI